MIQCGIEDKDGFRIRDERNGSESFGFDQEWFTTFWQRRSGCGPTVAAGIAAYFVPELCGGRAEGAFSRPACLTLMQKMWRYVTPTTRGVHKTCLMQRGAKAFALANALDFEEHTLDVPAKGERPALLQVVAFLEKSLNQGMPVAFLNLDNAGVEHLQSWHWVTLVALEAGAGKAFATIIDEGKCHRVDLAAWHQTTKGDGGFVALWFSKAAQG